MRLAHKSLGWKAFGDKCPDNDPDKMSRGEQIKQPLSPAGYIKGRLRPAGWAKPMRAVQSHEDCWLFFYEHISGNYSKFISSGIAPVEFCWQCTGGIREGHASGIETILLHESMQKTLWGSLKKLNKGLPKDSGILLLSLYSKEAILCLGIWFKKLKTGIQKNTSTPMFVTALLTLARKWEQSKCPSADERVNKGWHICTMEHCLAIKRKEGLIHATTYITPPKH